MEPSARIQWLDWTDEAFRLARDEDKPVILLLTAPWCSGTSAMEQSVYGDTAVAAFLARDYVAVRVDSDRRPDIFDRYSAGGWPTTAFLTPDGEFMGGVVALDVEQAKRIFSQLRGRYAAQKERIAGEIVRRDAKIAEALAHPGPGLEGVNMEIFRKTVRGIVIAFDPLHGGFGKSPKFPQVASLRVALQGFLETGGPDFREIMGRTLDNMGNRGMYDAARGGFFHFVTNDLWTIASTEKIGEDNAGLIRIYMDASLAMGEEKYAQKARHALGWVRTTLCDPGRGVFYGSQKADDEYYGRSPEERLAGTPPEVDPTVYTPASCAMASLFLRAAEVFGDESLAATALKGLDWLLAECVRGDEVAHYHDGSPQVFSLARDAIALGDALIDAYDHTGDRRRLEGAERLARSVMSRFWSEPHRGIIDRVASPGDPGELARPRRNIRENAAAAGLMARLWRHNGDDEFRRTAERLLLAYPDFLGDYGPPTAEYALAADWLVRPPTEVAGNALRPFVLRRVVRHR